MHVIVVAAMLLFASPAWADLIAVPRACAAVAERYGMIAPDKIERSEIERHMKSPDVIAIGILVPAVRRCRAALKVELKKP